VPNVFFSGEARPNHLPKVFFSGEGRPEHLPKVFFSGETQSEHLGKVVQLGSTRRRHLRRVVFWVQPSSTPSKGGLSGSTPFDTLEGGPGAATEARFAGVAAPSLPVTIERS
jgi:hypothetical protein